MNIHFYENLDTNFNVEKYLPTKHSAKTQKMSANAELILPKSIKRPMNAFMLWAKDRRRSLMENNPTLHNADISKILGSEWREMPDEKKNPFWKEAHILMMQHKSDHPEYHYKPRRQNKAKRGGKQQILATERFASKHERLLHKQSLKECKVESFKHRAKIVERREENLDYEAMDRLNYIRYLYDKKDASLTVKSALKTGTDLSYGEKDCNTNSSHLNSRESSFTTEDKSLQERKRQLDFFLQVSDSDESDVDSQRNFSYNVPTYKKEMAKRTQINYRNNSEKNLKNNPECDQPNAYYAKHLLKSKYEIKDNFVNKCQGEENKSNLQKHSFNWNPLLSPRPIHILHLDDVEVPNK